MKDDVGTVDTHTYEIYPLQSNHGGELGELVAFGRINGVQGISRRSRGPDLSKDRRRSIEANNVDLAMIDSEIATDNHQPVRLEKPTSEILPELS